jgi:hypothetical protein
MLVLLYIYIYHIISLFSKGQPDKSRAPAHDRKYIFWRKNFTFLAYGGGRDEERRNRESVCSVVLAQQTRSYM